MKSETVNAMGFPPSDPLAAFIGTVWMDTHRGSWAWAYSDTREPVKVPRIAASQTTADRDNSAPGCVGTVFWREDRMATLMGWRSGRRCGVHFLAVRKICVRRGT